MRAFRNLKLILAALAIFAVVATIGYRLIEAGRGSTVSTWWL